MMEEIDPIDPLTYLENLLKNYKSNSILHRLNKSAKDRYIDKCYNDLLNIAVTSEPWIKIVASISRKGLVNLDNIELEEKGQHLRFRIACKKQNIIIEAEQEFENTIIDTGYYDTDEPNIVVKDNREEHIIVLDDYDFIYIYKIIYVLRNIEEYIFGNKPMPKLKPKPKFEDLFTEKGKQNKNEILTILKTHGYLDENYRWFGVTGEKIEPIAIFYWLREFDFLHKGPKAPDCRIFLDGLGYSRKVSEKYMSSEPKEKAFKELNIMFAHLKK